MRFVKPSKRVQSLTIFVFNEIHLVEFLKTKKPELNIHFAQLRHRQYNTELPRKDLPKIATAIGEIF